MVTHISFSTAAQLKIELSISNIEYLVAKPLIVKGRLFITKQMIIQIIDNVNCQTQNKLSSYNVKCHLLSICQVGLPIQVQYL